MKAPLSFVSLLFVTLMQNPLTQAAVTIDAFDIAQGPLTGAGTFNAVSGSGILGTERDVQLSMFSTNSSFSIASGVLNLAQTNNFSDIFVTYDGVDNSAALSMGLGGVNLLSSGGNAFQVTLLPTGTSSPHAHLWLRAYTSASNYSETHLVLDAANFPSTINIPFATMDPTGSGASFSNINAVQMELAIGSSINMDMHVDSVAVVPEPSPSILVCLTAALACSVSRRFRRHSI